MWLAEVKVNKNAKQKETIDNGESWWEEVVIGLGNEFANLIDEKSNANPAQ